MSSQTPSVIAQPPKYSMVPAAAGNKQLLYLQSLICFCKVYTSLQYVYNLTPCASLLLQYVVIQSRVKKQPAPSDAMLICGHSTLMQAVHMRLIPIVVADYE